MPAIWQHSTRADCLLLSMIVVPAILFAGLQHIASVRCGAACEWGEWQLATGNCRSGRGCGCCCSSRSYLAIDAHQLRAHLDVFAHACSLVLAVCVCVSCVSLHAANNSWNKQQTAAEFKQSAPAGRQRFFFEIQFFNSSHFFFVICEYIL